MYEPHRIDRLIARELELRRLKRRRRRWRFRAVPVAAFAVGAAVRVIVKNLSTWIGHAKPWLNAALQLARERMSRPSSCSEASDVRPLSQVDPKAVN